MAASPTDGSRAASRKCAMRRSQMLATHGWFGPASDDWHKLHVGMHPMACSWASPRRWRLLQPCAEFGQAVGIAAHVSRCLILHLFFRRGCLQPGHGVLGTMVSAGDVHFLQHAFMDGFFFDDDAAVATMAPSVPTGFLHRAHGGLGLICGAGRTTGFATGWTGRCCCCCC